ncbi:hypothetical protein H9Q69_009779 [Fusarium xylarioides]|nr:hypothetical protein H9Q69_009779 [Fusarium xylarioides]
MRPVVPEEVGDLLKSRPVMIFNRTLLGPAYIESIVSSSPALVTSQGGKALPLEVWDMIIDFSNRCPENHRYSLVRPKLLKTSAGGDELACYRYKRWWSPFGNTYSLKGIEMLRFYLAHPDEPNESDHPNLDSIRLSSFYHPYPSSFKSPFAIPSIFPFDYFDFFDNLDFFDYYVSSCAIPTALLASKTKFLHVELTVPDVIKNLEDGNCECCHGKHVLAFA